MDINPPKCIDIDYIDFLIATSKVFSCTGAARCYPFIANAPSHDAFTRCLQRQPPDTEALWDKVKIMSSLRKASSLLTIQHWINHTQKKWLLFVVCGVENTILL